MKNTVLSLLIFGLFCTLSSCKSKDNTQYNELSVANPYVQVESTSDFVSDLNIQLTAPDQAINKSYFIINRRIAEINFTLDETYYTFRASNKVKKDLSGIFEKTVQCQQFYINNSIEVNIMTTNADIKYATWSVKETHYSLSMNNIIDNEYILNFIQDTLQ